MRYIRADIWVRTKFDAIERWVAYTQTALRMQRESSSFRGMSWAWVRSHIHTWLSLHKRTTHSYVLAHFDCKFSECLMHWTLTTRTKSYIKLPLRVDIRAHLFFIDNHINVSLLYTQRDSNCAQVYYVRLPRWATEWKRMGECRCVHLSVCLCILRVVQKNITVVTLKLLSS